MVGCYGIPTKTHSYCGVPLDYESGRMQVEGFIVTELPPPNHYLSIYDLHTWLSKSNVPSMYRVDTGALVKEIREQGVVTKALAHAKCSATLV